MSSITAPPWTIRTTLEWTQGHFEAKGVENPRLSAQWLLADVTGLSRLELYTNYDLPLAEAQLAALRANIKRRVAGEPLQYILGKAPFRHLEVKVRPGVLIPRPETEVLVGYVVDEVRGLEASRPPQAQKGLAVPQSPQAQQPPQAAHRARVLDIGTGTGCIALSLLSECPEVCVVATDIDPVAVGLAWENACELGFEAGERLAVLEDDLAASLLADEIYRGAFDVVVSNPPYIPTAELDELPAEVKGYEPRQALDGGVDGLAVFRRIVEQAAVLLRPGGLLACELHEATLEAAARFCREQGYEEVAIHPDLTNKPRILAARRPVLC